MSLGYRMRRSGDDFPPALVECGHCGHRWKTRAIVPKTCPKCKKAATEDKSIKWITED